MVGDYMNGIERIEKAIDSLKVIDYHEEVMKSDSKFITMKNGHYSLNNGKTIDRESVVKNVGSGDAACIFAVTIDKKILLVINPRVVLPTDTKVSIEIPAGYIESDEDSIIAARRELEEETGYTAHNIKKIDSYYPALGISGERIDLYLALDCEKTSSQHLDSDEFLICESVTLEEFEYLLEHQYIIDANARIGYYRYLDCVKKGLL